MNHFTYAVLALLTLALVIFSLRIYLQTRYWPTFFLIAAFVEMLVVRGIMVYDIGLVHGNWLRFFYIVHVSLMLMCVVPLWYHVRKYWRKGGSR